MPPAKILTPKADASVDQREYYFTFRPRRDQPERYDEQTAFCEAKPTGVSFLLGGNGSGTTECALNKVAKFVLAEQPPPRPDTPFWIISDTYETVCEAAWKEKLLGHGHIPAAEIDAERIQWFKQLRGWPLAVPLKPWVDRPGKNWVLEFKSYKQGRALMQARSIGGFCFIEQFPWILLTEVFRGCREYAFRGNKIAEFTPVEPGLTEELEDMLEKDELPTGWEIYRCNTTCALEAGHVTREWYDAFFSMVPESMRATREIGAMPTYEGAIYGQFNPRVHCLDIDLEKVPPGLHHRRSIDWGSGPDNAFCCLWGCRNAAGQWLIYDEYFSNDTTMSVVDHLCVVHDRWPWPFNNPYYGTTWADPSDPGYFRIASRLSEYGPRSETTNKPLYQNLPLSGAANAVHQGIEHVQYLLKPQKGLVNPFGDPKTLILPGGYPRLFIDRTNCRNLRREMRTYRWQTRNANVPHAKDARPEPLKLDDHAVDALRYLVYSEANFTISAAASMHKEDRASGMGVQLQRGRRHGIPFARGKNR